MDAEIALIAEEEGGRGGDGTDPELKRRGIRDQVGDVGADLALDIADRADGTLERRHINLDRKVDLVDVDEALSERSWHRPVELDDDRVRCSDGCVDRLDGRAQ